MVSFQGRSQPFIENLLGEGPQRVYHLGVTTIFGLRTTVTYREQIIEALNELSPQYLDVINESDMHAGPPGRESHFRVRIVSSAFDDARLVNRHRKVNALLKGFMVPGGVHALALETYTADEWTKRGGAGIDSPDCEGKR